MRPGIAPTCNIHEYGCQSHAPNATVRYQQGRRKACAWWQVPNFAKDQRGQIEYDYQTFGDRLQGRRAVSLHGSSAERGVFDAPPQQRNMNDRADDGPA